MKRYIARLQKASRIIFIINVIHFPQSIMMQDEMHKCKSTICLQAKSCEYLPLQQKLRSWIVYLIKIIIWNIIVRSNTPSTIAKVSYCTSPPNNHQMHWISNTRAIVYSQHQSLTHKFKMLQPKGANKKNTDKLFTHLAASWRSCKQITL